MTAIRIDVDRGAGWTVRQVGHVDEGSVAEIVGLLPLYAIQQPGVEIAMSVPLLTPKQDRLLRFLSNFHAQKGFAPSIREMKLGLSLNSKGSIVGMLDRLVKKGFITRAKGSWHGTVVIQQPPALQSGIVLSIPDDMTDDEILAEVRRRRGLVAAKTA